MKKLMHLIAIIGLALIFQPLTVFAIGQMTEPIVIKNGIQGETFEETLYILNTEGKENTFKITAENDIAGWVKFYDSKNPDLPIEKITIPKNSRYNITAKIEIPKGTPNGKYSGVIGVAVSLDDKEGGKSSETVSEKVDRKVRITVTDKESISLKTSVIPAKYSLKKGEPLKIRFIYDNQSNIKVRPQIQVKLKKDGKIVRNAIYPYPEELESVNSFSMKEITPLEIQTTGLEDGRYLAEMTMIVNEENKYDDHFSFTIGNVTDGSNNSGFISFISRIGGGNITLGWILIGGFFAALAILIAAIGRKRKFLKIWKKKM